MLEVTFVRDSRSRLSSVFATGHAEFADRGEDIVCAAVSAILQAARLGLTAYAKLDLDAGQSPGILRLNVGEYDRDREDVRAILATAELSIEQIASQFPSHVVLCRETAG